MPFADVNSIAVLAATVANMVLGMIWYHPSVLGSMWARELGIKIDKKNKEGMAQSFAVGIGSTLVLAYFIGLLLAMARPGSLQAALLLGSIFWVGIVVPMELSRVAWERISWTLFVINSAWMLVSISAITAIHTWL